jgi:hypothetical protein
VTGGYVLRALSLGVLSALVGCPSGPAMRGGRPSSPDAAAHPAVVAPGGAPDARAASAPASGDGEEHRMTAPGEPVGEALAVASFRAWWSAALRHAPAARRLDPVVSGRRPTARRVSFEAYRVSVQRRLGDGPVPAEWLVGGALPEGDGACWVLFFDGLLRSGVEVCVDAADGQVRLVWETPEG